MASGGRREGSGRKAKAYGTLPAKSRAMHCTEEEYTMAVKLVSALRSAESPEELQRQFEEFLSQNAPGAA